MEDDKLLHCKAGWVLRTRHISSNSMGLESKGQQTNQPAEGRGHADTRGKLGSATGESNAGGGRVGGVGTVSTVRVRSAGVGGGGRSGRGGAVESDGALGGMGDVDRNDVV